MGIHDVDSERGQKVATELGLAARVQNLTRTYGAGANAVHAVDDLSVGIRR